MRWTRDAKRIERKKKVIRDCMKEVELELGFEEWNNLKKKKYYRWAFHS